MACRNGPLDDNNRSCTNMFCLLIFLGVCGGMGAVAKIGYTKGDPARLTYPYDPDRNLKFKP